MTVLVNIGRRVPRNWFRRQASRVGGLISFQENLWIMIKESMKMGRKKCNASGKGEWVMTTDREVEDMHYEIEWIKNVIQGSEAFEEDEWKDAQQLYKPFGKLLKKDMPKDERLAKQFKTKMLSHAKVDEAYKEGYGSVEDKNISNKLLEMGILTHVEWVKDFDAREKHYDSL